MSEYQVSKACSDWHQYISSLKHLGAMDLIYEDAEKF
jgi:hypothetical protein